MADQDVGTQHHVHHWQWGNPVTSEALIQLALGAPQPIYNGGLLHARLRYFDLGRRRSGLPIDVAALVEKLSADSTTVQLVNTSVTESRNVLIQAGTFGEHRFTEANFETRTSNWPGGLGGYAGTYSAERLVTKTNSVTMKDSKIEILIRPGMEIRLKLKTQRYVNDPSYKVPF